jgi:5'-3' exonuclease
MCYHRGQPILNILDDIAQIPIGNFSRIYWCYDTYTSKYHKAIYPEYKENRTTLRAKQTDAEKAKYKKFSEEYNALKEITKFFGTNISIQNTEADTMIEVLADKFITLGYTVYIASNDGDFSALLETPNLFQITTKYQVLDAGMVFRKKGATPHQLFLSKCISGDTKDNIKGLQGLGEIKDTKTGIKIKKIFQEHGDYVRTVVEVLQDLVDKGKFKLPEDYPCTNVQELYEFNYKLNKPFVFTDLTLEDQELLKEQVNAKRVLFDEEEFNAICFEVFSKGIIVSESTKGFYNVK